MKLQVLFSYMVEYAILFHSFCSSSTFEADLAVCVCVCVLHAGDRDPQFNALAWPVRVTGPLSETPLDARHSPAYYFRTCFPLARLRVTRWIPAAPELLSAGFKSFL